MNRVRQVVHLATGDFDVGLVLGIKREVVDRPELVGLLPESVLVGKCHCIQHLFELLKARPRHVQPVAVLVVALGVYPRRGVLGQFDVGYACHQCIRQNLHRIRLFLEVRHRPVYLGVLTVVKERREQVGRADAHALVLVEELLEMRLVLFERPYHRVIRKNVAQRMVSRKC